EAQHDGEVVLSEEGVRVGDEPDEAQHHQHARQAEQSHIDGPPPSWARILLLYRRPVECFGHAALPSMTRSRMSASVSSPAGRCSSTRPSRTTSTRSARPSTSGISLDTSTTATPDAA